MERTGKTVAHWVLGCSLLLAGGCEELDFAFPVLKDSPGGAAAEAGTRYALVLGIDRYDPAYIGNPLNSCVNDATGFSGKLAADTGRWKESAAVKAPANLFLWTNSQATLSAVRSKLQDLARIAKPGDLVVYYQSSHGDRSSGRDASLCMYNASYTDMLFASDLTLFADGVKIVIVLDTCYSAGMFKDGAAATTWDFPQRVMAEIGRIRVEKNVAGPSVGWLTSSDYDETSLAGSPYSRFTGHLIRAFCYGDSSGDGNLTFKELFDYAAPRTAPAHHPQSLNDELLTAVVAAKASTSCY